MIPKEDVPALVKEKAPGVPKRTLKEEAILAETAKKIPPRIETEVPIEHEGILVGEEPTIELDRQTGVDIPELEGERSPDRKSVV